MPARVSLNLLKKSKVSMECFWNKMWSFFGGQLQNDMSSKFVGSTHKVPHFEGLQTEGETR